MKKVFILFMVLGVGCSSNDPTEEVKADAKTTYRDVTSHNQYSRALSMVEADQNLTPTEKDNLTSLIREYSQKMQKNKNLQSKYRAILVREMLNTGTSKNPKVDAARDELLELNEESDKELQEFVRDFKFYAGENARIHQPTLIEATSM